MSYDINRVIIGDVREIAKTLPDCSVNCIITSPPYWGLRDYGTAEWVGGDVDCDHSPKRKNGYESTSLTGGITGNHMHEGFKGNICPKCGAIRKDNQIGLESTPQEHVAIIVDVFRELRRVLRDDGTLWLNYGDCYATSANGRSAADTKAAGNDDRTYRDKPFSTVAGNLKPKDLVGMPWRDLIKPCILAGCPEGGIVLDPFMGSGTVAQVAIELRRNWLGIELNPEYVELTQRRIASLQPMLIPEL